MSFERWTERARKVIVLAQEEARRTKQSKIESGHILLGLLREVDDLAARCLTDLGVTFDAAREIVDKTTGTGTCEASGQLEFTEDAQSVIDKALREALSMGCNYIGTEHILLAVTRTNTGSALRTLLSLGADSEKIRNEVYNSVFGARAPELPGTRLDQRIVDALPDLRRAAGKLQGNAEIVVRTASRNGDRKPIIVIRRGPDGQGRLYTTGEVL